MMAVVFPEPRKPPTQAILGIGVEVNSFVFSRSDIRSPIRQEIGAVPEGHGIVESDRLYHSAMISSGAFSTSALVTAAELGVQQRRKPEVRWWFLHKPIKSILLIGLCKKLAERRRPRIPTLQVP
jgi:hypothetical protein